LAHNPRIFSAFSQALRLVKWLRNIILVGITLSMLIVLALRWLPPPTSMFMAYRHGEDWLGGGRFYAIDYRWMDGKSISSNAYAAVVAAEDQQFFEHFGFDIKSIQNSLEDYQDGGRLRGASTISQQVAKNLFLTPAKSFLRKGVEAWFTVLLELFWSKQRILTVYLNIAEFGDHLFGIEAASQRYFGVPAKALSRQQAALLAATLPNPMLLRVAKPSGYVLRRQAWILRQMRNLGGLPD
jgi:monofunctional biosynthetic peptidoglycan transglycosylase